MEMVEEFGELMTPADVAAILKVTKKTVYKAIAEGRIPRLVLQGVPGVIRIEPRSLSIWLRTHNPALALGEK